MANYIPINKNNLIWARESAGFSQEELLKKFPKYIDWEKGSANPTYSQLEQLAFKFHRPLAIFFFPDLPEEQSIEKSLRAIRNEDVETLTPSVRFLFRKAKAFQIYLKELYKEELHEQAQKIKWLSLQSNHKPILELANYAREYLGITINDQILWSDSDEALNKWREILAKKGVYIFKEAFKNDKISGFCVYDPYFPLIFINNSLSKNRQIFTIFHELGHLFFEESYLDVFDDTFWRLEYEKPDHIEVKCNAFAGHFLVPDSEINKNTIGDVDIDNKIECLASYYKVSKEVILRKFLNAKYINNDYYFNKINEWYGKSKKEEKKSSGGSYYNTKLAYLGDTYLATVFNKYYQGKISIEKASEYLDIKMRSFNGIEDAFLRKGGNNVYI